MSDLDKQMQNAVDHYAEDIKTLKDFITSIRKVPGMYIGTLNNKGELTLIREIFQNSIDQLIDPGSPCSEISVTYDERTLECSVADNGLGIPFTEIIRVFTKPHTSKNFIKHKGVYPSGLHGVGGKCVNALSEYFIVESYRYDGTAVRMEFNRGYPKTDQPKKIPNKEKKQGTIITFSPDTTILGDINLEWKSIYRLIKQIISLTDIGSVVHFMATDISGKTFKEDIINKDGIITNLIQKIKRPIIKPIIVSDNDGEHKLDCAFCYDSGDDEQGPSDMENVTSFCNFSPTIEGAHIDGVLDGITKWFSDYMNNVFLLNQKAKDKLKVNANDIKTGLNIMISAAHIEPNFTGQAKEILSNPDMRPFCKNVVIKGLDEWSKSNPSDLAKISKYFKDIATLRQRNESAKKKIVTKYQSNVLTGLPAKYVRPLGNKNLELVIVEGDSALGTVQLGRDRNTQGLLPIRGKIINAFKCSKEKFFENQEVQGINRIILGSDYHKNFKVEECKVEKVIFMADADVDDVDRQLTFK